jgi:glutamate N-acetyltransferase/amino-acid N-acetyltransferase
MHQPPAELDGFRVVPGGTLAARGFVGGGVAAGIKATSDLDLGAILSTRTPCQSAATFTTNRVRGTSVTINQERLSRKPARGIVFNSGNANTYTGAGGRADALEFIDAFAGRFGVPADEVLVASTGVIGFRLPMPKVLAGVEALELTAEAGADVAAAMLTTDVAPKTLAIEVPVSSGTIRIGGAAKGAGMVHPNMATMFVFMTTDAEVEGATLHRQLSAAVADSFNLISIDGDQSTSDTALLLANGASETGLLQEGTADATAFTRGLHAVCRWLSREIVRGGEGVTKVFAVTVRGASDEATARQAARAITTSSLVKTAVHGGDPNWGRIVMALGNSGASFDPDVLDIWIGDTQVVRQGAPAVYDEATVAEHLQHPDVTIEVALNQGEASATAWGGDLSAEYVAINAEYMT